MGCAGRCWWCWWPWRCAGSLVLVKPTAGGRLFEKSRRRDVVDRGAAAGGGAGGRGAGRGAASVRARVKGCGGSMRRR